METQIASNNGETTETGTVRRVRLVSVQVELNVVLDDGTVLEPLRVQPIQVSAANWPGFDLDSELAQLQRQLDEAR
jgi:hypothetical protein